MKIDEILCIDEGKPIFSCYLKEYDIASFALKLNYKWFQKSNYHITRGKDKNSWFNALVLAEHEEISQYVKKFYIIKLSDFRLNCREFKSELYSIVSYEE